MVTKSECLAWIIAASLLVKPVFAQQAETIPPPPLGTPASAPATAPPATAPAPAAPSSVVTTAAGPTPAASEAFKQWLRSNSPGSSMPSGKSAVVYTNSRAVPVNTFPPRTPGPLSFEQEQQIMLNTVPKAKPPTTPEETAAFTAMLKQNMPLSPQQVVQLHQQIDTAQRAAATPPVIPPKPVSSTIMVNLAPGTTPPAVRLAQGYVSSLVFVDSTGAPWPIASFDIGNPKALNIQWDGKSNIILMQAVSPYSYGDIVVRLLGLPTPLTLELISGQRVVDYRADIHVPGIGPNTKDLPVGVVLPGPANQLLLGVLDGVAPPGSKLLTIHGGDCQVWLLGDKMYLRTRLNVLSPGWVGKMTSPDGTLAYELPRTSSILVSRYGVPTELRVEGF